MRSLAAAIVGVALGAIIVSGCGTGATSNGGGPSSAGAGAETPAGSLSAPPSSSASNAEVSTMPSTSSFALTSAAFQDGGSIPREFTCDGRDVSPALAWSGAPAGTVELVLVVDDPDAGGFVHWIIVISAAGDGSLAEGISRDASAYVQGVNGFGRVGYGGPCPPSGTHHYRFTLSAVGSSLGLTGHPHLADVRGALGRANVLGSIVLTGTYRRG